jgi:glutamate:GABA antiporter
MKTKTTYLSIFKLIMITSAFVLSIRNMPMLAETGMQMFFYIIVAAIIYLIPVGLVSAELATGWPKEGGVYVWIKEAFGEKWAFFSIWMLWVQMFFGMVMITSFIAAMWAYVFYPPWANNETYIVIMILVMYWGVTLLNLKGLKAASLISTIGVVFGVFIPAALILVLGAIYLFQGNPVNMDFSFTANNIIPNFSNIGNLAFFVSVVFVFAGLEVSSVHANEVKDPQKNYPKAMFMGILLLIILNIFGSLIVGIVVPKNEISLVAGIMQTFEIFLTKFDMKWLIPIVALFAAVGATGQISTWVLGPSKGMLGVAKNGDLPPWWQKENKYGVPTHIIFTQATAISLVALLYLVVPSINSVFFMILILTTLLYAIMYIFMFASGIKLRYSQPNVPRAYKVPGKNNIGMWILGVFGLISMAFVVVIAFFPPEIVSSKGNSSFYVWFMAIGLAFFVIIPLIVFKFKKPEWKKEISPKKLG